MADHHVKPAMHGGLDNEMGANDQNFVCPDDAQNFARGLANLPKDKHGSNIDPNAPT